jgi:hypothetical protein
MMEAAIEAASQGLNVVRVSNLTQRLTSRCIDIRNSSSRAIL